MAATIEELIARVDRLEKASDRAFHRWMLDEVSSSSGAASLASKVEEARADVRFHPDFDADLERHREAGY